MSDWCSNIRLVFNSPNLSNNSKRATNYVCDISTYCQSTLSTRYVVLRPIRSKTYICLTLIDSHKIVYLGMICRSTYKSPKVHNSHFGANSRTEIRWNLSSSEVKAQDESVHWYSIILDCQMVMDGHCIRLIGPSSQHYQTEPEPTI